MDKLSLLKELLENPQVSDAVLQFYLDCAKNIICEIRFADYVEPQYETTQIKIAIELFSKRGAEGQLAHSENGIARTYERADVSPSLLAEVTPFARTPYSTVRTLG